MFPKVFDAAAKARQIMLFCIAVPFKLERANNEKHTQNEGPIHVAFRDVFSFHETAKGSFEPFDYVTFCGHLTGFGCQIGAHWILKGSLNRQFSNKINIKLENVGTKSGARNKHGIMIETRCEKLRP